MGRTGKAFGAVAALSLLCGTLAAQQQDKPKQDIPDAPSASRPFPNAPLQGPAPQNQAPPEQAPPPPNQAPPTSSSSTEEPVYAPGVAPAPPFNVTTVPQGGAPAGHTAGSDELFKITVNTNQVVVPVMVKDDSGRLVNGLFSRDFSVFEDGKKQNLNFFTTDPFALSAAVLFDTGMPDVAVQKVIQTFSAMEGAFSEFDEVSLYTYSTSVSRVTDFSAVGRRLTAALDSLKLVTGRNNGPPVTSGPLGPQGPIVNGRPVEGGAPRVTNPPKESHVLNDAIVAAALELRKRDRTRRKVIFIVSDGREYGSNASYSDTLKVLLSSGVQVYGVAVEGSAVPGIRLPAKAARALHGLATWLQQHPAQVCQRHRRRDFQRIYPRRHRGHLCPRPGRCPQPVHPGISDPRHPQQHTPRNRSAGGAFRPHGNRKGRLLPGWVGSLRKIADFRLNSFAASAVFLCALCGQKLLPRRTKRKTAKVAENFPAGSVFNLKSPI